MTQGTKKIEDYPFAFWLVAEGDFVILKLEVNKKWITIIKERLDSPFSHIIEPLGIQEAIKNEM